MPRVRGAQSTTWIVFSLLILFLCSDFLGAQSRELNRIATLRKDILSEDERDRERAIARIYRRFPRYDVEEQDAAVEAVSQSKSRSALKFLIRVLLEDDTRDASTRDRVVELFVERDYVGAEAVIAKAITQYPKMQKAVAITYIGKNQFVPAISLLQSYVRNEQNLSYSYRALADMQNADAHRFLEIQCLRFEYKNCYPCLKSLAEVKKNRFRSRADRVFSKILREYRNRLPQCVEVAYNYFINSTHNAEGKALAKLVATRIQFPSKVKKVKRKVSRGKKKRLFGVYPRDYVTRLIATIARKTGRSKAQMIYQQMETGFTENLRYREDVREFVQRAYRKGLRLSSASALRALERGTQYPGSVHVIGRYVIRQYKTKKLQIYSISQILNISQAEAAIIYDIAKFDRLV